MQCFSPHADFWQKWPENAPSDRIRFVNDRRSEPSSRPSKNPTDQTLMRPAKKHTGAYVDFTQSGSWSLPDRRYNSAPSLKHMVQNSEFVADGRYVYMFGARIDQLSVVDTFMRRSIDLRLLDASYEVQVRRILPVFGLYQIDKGVLILVGGCDGTQREVLLATVNVEEGTFEFKYLDTYQWDQTYALRVPNPSTGLPFEYVFHDSRQHDFDRLIRKELRRERVHAVEEIEIPVRIQNCAIIGGRLYAFPFGHPWKRRMGMSRLYVNYLNGRQDAWEYLSLDGYDRSSNYSPLGRWTSDGHFYCSVLDNPSNRQENRRYEIHCLNLDARMWHQFNFYLKYPIHNIGVSEHGSLLVETRRSLNSKRGRAEGLAQSTIHRIFVR